MRLVLALPRLAISKHLRRNHLRKIGPRRVALARRSLSRLPRTGREEAAMLRITRMTGSEPGESLTLEGKLVGPWVAALRESCEGRAPLRLDLAAVSFADAAGVELLRELLAVGATLVCSALV